MKNNFVIDVPEDVIQKIYTRVKEYPWHEMPDDGGCLQPPGTYRQRSSQLQLWLPSSKQAA